MSDENPGRPFEELRDEGLLWLINATVFHPRGYALAMHHDDKGHATGWSIVGDGAERWTYAEEQITPEGKMSDLLDEQFLRAKRFMP